MLDGEPAMQARQHAVLELNVRHTRAPQRRPGGRHLEPFARLRAGQHHEFHNRFLMHNAASLAYPSTHRQEYLPDRFKKREA